MSTVKIKTEPTAAVDVQVKLEPSLSTSDIKLEQHASDIDTKVESDSEGDSDIKSENDDYDNDDADQNQAAEASNNQRQFICEYLGCGRRFKSGKSMRLHQREHRLQTDISIFGKSYILARQSLDDRWPCPIPDCTSTYKTVSALYAHIRRDHGDIVEQQQHQQPSFQFTLSKRYFVNVDDFYVNGVRCSFHTTTGVFICHECRLVPECLLTHLQQKHGYDEKSIDTAILPESAVNANVDPNTNQHTSNQLLASAISRPHWQHQHGIVPGWFCVTSNCGYCGYSTLNKDYHKKSKHQGEQISTVPALVLRLPYGKTLTTCFLITRIDQASGAVTTGSSIVKQHNGLNSHNEFNTQDESEDDVDLNKTTDTSNQKRQWRCEYNGCRRLFNSANVLCTHRREHTLEVVVTVRGAAFTLSRQSLDDRWACPFPECNLTYKTTCGTHAHIQLTHGISMKQKRRNIEDNDNQQQGQQIIKRRQRTNNYVNVDDVYVGRTRCGYHTTTGVFICHECKLVPECLLTHLQQKHGYSEKSIDNSALPESAVNARANPNVNQHICNPHLASAIRDPYQWRNSDIVQGWLCVTSDCGHCFTQEARNKHQYKRHRGEQLSSVPALVLRLLYAKSKTSSFLITRLDTASNNSVGSSNSTIQQNGGYDDDDGDELVLSDYSD